MKECGRCHTMVPDTTVKCTGCGALVVAAPAPPAKVPATVGAPSVEPANANPSLDPFGAFPVDPMRGVTVKAAPPKQQRRPVALMFVAVLVVLAIGTAAYGVARGTDDSSSGGENADAPVVLTPDDPTSGGLSGALSRAVRVQAEANRQAAFAAIMQAQIQGDGILDLEMLRAIHPQLAFVAGERSSTGPNEVSVRETPEGVVIAIAASNKTVCAFGRLPNAGAGIGEFVTMANVASCAATDAPAAGWSQLAGGYGVTPPLDS